MIVVPNAGGVGLG